MPAPAVVGWIVAGISRIFATRLGGWAAAALAFLGLQWATHSFVMAPVIGQVQAAIGGAGGDAVAWLGFFNLDRYITIILSAYAVASGKRAFLRRRSA